MPRVVLKPHKAGPFYARHPWVLDRAIDYVEGDPADGDVVDLANDKGKWIARGVFNRQSRIQARLYTWSQTETLDAAFWRRRIEQALALRTALGYDDPAGACRLVFSESDGLSGLIIDRYADQIVMQVTALAMAVRIDELVPLVGELARPRGITLRTDPALAKTEGIELSDRVAWGEPPSGPIVIREHGIRYQVDVGAGQKTGFYLDQRENRRAAAGYLRGRRVLDMFCYSGGFGLAAVVLGQARELLGYDSSQKAVELARANAALNGVTCVCFETGDAFDTLQTLVGTGERFGAVVLDPPKFARSRRSLDEALRAYHHLNRLAVRLVEPGGILVTCSCSGHVTRDDFLFMLVGVARKTGRELQFLEVRGAAPDHPVNANCLDNEYLKCVICRVT